MAPTKLDFINKEPTFIPTSATSNIPILYKPNQADHGSAWFKYIYRGFCAIPDSGIQKEVIKRYLEYLEAAFLIKVIYKVDDNAKRFKRVMSFKVYLTNPSLRTALFSPVEESDQEMGNMVETTIFSQWMHREDMDLKYARWKVARSEGEADMVSIDNKLFRPQWCVEMKWSRC